MRGAVAVLAILVLTPFAFSDDENGKVVKQLRQEKVAKLRDIYERTKAAYETGNASFRDLLDSAMSVHEGTLEAAESKEQRLAVHREMMKTAEEMVKTAEALVKANELQVAELLKAQVTLIERKIAFEKEKAAHP